jgi:hypothetical protein
MRRLAILVLAAGAVTLAAAVCANAALFFLFKPTSAEPGDHVTVRTAGTPASFKPVRRRQRFSHPIRIYLVRNDTADKVHSRFDSRLTGVGAMLTDTNVRGILAFTVPRLHAGSYAVAAWCPDCGAYSKGRTFFTLPVGDWIAPRYRRLMLLRIVPRPRIR